MMGVGKRWVRRVLPLADVADLVEAIEEGHRRLRANRYVSRRSPVSNGVRHPSSERRNGLTA
jgi:hypothetical protein